MNSNLENSNISIVFPERDQSVADAGDDQLAAGGRAGLHRPDALRHGRYIQLAAGGRAGLHRPDALQHG